MTVVAAQETRGTVRIRLQRLMAGSRLVQEMAPAAAALDLRPTDVAVEGYDAEDTSFPLSLFRPAHLARFAAFQESPLDQPVVPWRRLHPRWVLKAVKTDNR